MEIAPGVYSMSQEQGGHVHAFLLDDGQSLTLIDSLYDDDGNGVLAEVQRIGKSSIPHHPTHAHKSHIGGGSPRWRVPQRDGVLASVGGGYHRRPA
jgi:hypothetical protein